MIPIALAVEDDLSEWVLRKVLDTRGMDYHVGPVFKRGGFGYLRKQCGAFNNMARACPVILLTDLDQWSCAPQLLEGWLPQGRHPNFLLRVAIREVEAWLLAEDESFGQFLGLRRILRIPDPESLPDPKMELLKIAQTGSRREHREGLVRRDSGGNLRQGPAYNSILADFVTGMWQPEKAAKRSDSLARVISALEGLEKRYRGDQ